MLCHIDFWVSLFFLLPGKFAMGKLPWKIAMGVIHQGNIREGPSGVGPCAECIIFMSLRTPHLHKHLTHSNLQNTTVR